jgi:hypothetical protein
MSYNLLRFPWVKTLFINRWPQLLLRALALAGFALTGLIGTPVGNRNFTIVGVWIAWWAALMLMLVPLLGRSWCAVCPIPLPGEWMQNGAVLGPKPDGSSGAVRFGGRRFPKIFRNIWLQNGAFTLLAVFSAVILTRPSVSAWLLLGMILVAVAVSVVYERRSFCRYLCPVGGFIGLYSQLAPVELRVIDSQVCASHRQKSCFRGNQAGYGCPWNIFPGALKVNTNCGLCMECLRTCEYDNIALNLRAFGADLKKPQARGLDEAYKVFILLGSALVYSAVMLGPWGLIKDAAYRIGSLSWWGYTLGLLALTWGLLPGLFYLTTRAAHTLAPTVHNPRQSFTAYSVALLPLGLTAWVAFSLAFVFANLSYLWPVLSDPFGWGWNLFGTAGASWTPYLSGLMPGAQLLVLVGGLAWSGHTAWRIAKERRSVWQAAPMIAFCGLITILMMGLLLA